MPVATPPRERSPSEAWAAGGVRAVSPYRRQSQHRRTPRRRPLFERLDRPPLGNDAARARLLSFGQVPRGRRLGLTPQPGRFSGEIGDRPREPWARRSRRVYDCPYAEVYPLIISQANATAAAAPSTGNPSRTAMSERHSGSRRRWYFRLRRRLTTAAESQKSGEDDLAAEVPHFASLLWRGIPGRAPPPRPGQESPAAFSSGVFPAPTALNKPRSSCRPS